MSSHPQGSQTGFPATAEESARAGVSPAEALSSAFDDVLRLLFTPFDGRRWIKLSILCLFLGGGTPSAAFHWSLGSLPSDVGFRDALEQVRQYVGQHLWLVILATVLSLTLGLILLYLRSVFRFMLVDSLLKQEVFLGPAWADTQSLGRSYFFWLLGALVAVGTALAVVTVIAFPYLRAASPAGSRSWASSVALASLLAAVVLVGLLGALVITLTDDLVVPVMYAERLPLLAAWRKLWKNLRADTASFMVYVLLRFVVSVAVGAAVLFFLFPALLGFFSGAIIAGALVVLALHLVGVVWVWNPFTIILATLVLLLLTGFLLVLLSAVGMPGQVFIQDFGMRFIAPRVPSLERLWRFPARGGRRR